ncbi:MAG: NADH-quinone oxidoreductase subunit NuoN [Actinomycetales bacterium]|nr:NADH-quinone oxidoreductase subunit NuoN [Actinomycetales bacterium]
MSFTPPTLEWLPLAPIAIVLGVGVLGVLVEAFVPRSVRRTTHLVLTFLALVGALVAGALQWQDTLSTGGVSLFGGSYQLDGPALALQLTLVILTILAVAVFADRTSQGQDAFAPTASAVPGSDYEELARREGLEQTEVYPLALFGLGGMLLFVAAGDLLTLFVALEVLSLPLYILTGLARRRRLLSQEASLKYMLLGAYASAFFLFGAELLYGFAGSVNLSEIAASTGAVVGLDGLLLAGSLLLLVGLFFKVGAVPFHSWTPDVYVGAPTPVTGFMAATTKIAAFGAMARIVYVLLPALEWDLRPALWTVAILTMVVGTVVAIVQTDVKRMLAYSSIAHAGFVLVGVLSFNAQGIGATLFYLVVYGFATVGAFAVVTLVRQTRTTADGTVVLGEATHLSQWAGLGKRAPWLAAALALFLLSFAGIPLTAGFAGKFAVFTAAVDGGAVWLVVVGVLASAASAFFYVRLIVLMYFTPEPENEGGEGVTVVRSQGFTTAVLVVTAAVTVLLGVLPGWLLDGLGEAAKFLP